MSHSIEATAVTRKFIAMAQLAAMYQWHLRLCLAELLFMLNTAHCLLHVAEVSYACANKVQSMLHSVTYFSSKSFRIPTRCAVAASRSKVTAAAAAVAVMVERQRQQRWLMGTRFLARGKMGALITFQSLCSG